MTANASEKSVLALGADLNAEQRAVVLSAMGLTEETAAACETIYITNEMEHKYLDASLGADVVGKRSLSSVLLIPQAEGTGLNVETHNINYCTIAMYRNALLTAGVEDAKVIVAAPASISGTAALIGAVKAYETYSGTSLAEEAFAAATDELVLTGERKRLYVTLGQFSIIRLERDAQLIVPVLDYAIPTKECCETPGCAEDPCEMFSRIPFPSRQFTPQGCDRTDDDNCNCRT
jgi:hypothetical protein